MCVCACVRVCVCVKLHKRSDDVSDMYAELQETRAQVCVCVCVLCVWCAKAFDSCPALSICLTCVCVS